MWACVCWSLFVRFFILFSSAFVFIIIFCCFYSSSVWTIGDGAWEPTIYSSSRSNPWLSLKKKNKNLQKKPTEKEKHKNERCPPICLGFRCHFLTLQPEGNTHLAILAYSPNRNSLRFILWEAAASRRDTKTAFCIDKCILRLCGFFRKSATDVEGLFLRILSSLSFRDPFCCSVYIADSTLTHPFWRIFVTTRRCWNEALLF